MNHIIYFLLFLISFNGIGQKYADTEYYLIDSLVIEDLSPQDKNVLDSCLKIYHLTKSDSSKVQILSSIIDPMVSEKWKKYQYYQYDLILSALEEKPSNKEVLALRICLSDALSNIGLIFSDQGKITEALDYYNQGFRIYKELDDSAGIALSLNNIGSIYSDQGLDTEAFDYYNRSLKIREAIGDESGVANSLHNLAAIYDEGRKKKL